MFKVISTFADLLDNNYVYNEGAEYPRKGYSPSSDRIEELSTNRNKLRKPLIERIAVKETEEVNEEVTEEPVEVTEEPVEITEKPARGRRKAKDDNAD